jgi:hypothetical protein
MPRRSAISPTLIVAGLAVLTAVTSRCVSSVGEPTPQAGVTPPSSSAAQPKTSMFVHAAPILVLEQLEGVEAGPVNAAFAPATTALAQCHPGSSGVIRLKITAAPGKARYVVVPTTSLGPQTRRCVLETLSTVDVDGISESVSPSARPSGFTALLRLEW